MAHGQKTIEMTKEEMVELVYLRIHGGKPSGDVNIKRVNVSFYFGPAYNYAVLLDYYERHNMMLREKRIMGYSSQKILSQQLCTYQVTAVEDSDRGLCYVVLPKSLMVLPGARGLDSIFGGPEDSFVKVSGQEEVVGLEAAGAKFFWFEKYPSENRVYIKGGCGDCPLYLRMMVDASDIGDKDEVMLPAGREALVLDKMAEWFLGERQIPENVINENVDDIRRRDT